MLRPSQRFAVAVAGLTLAAFTGTARGADVYTVDPVHSTVLFRVKHMGTSFAYGRFNEFSGTFSLDNDRPADSAVELSLKPASIDTGNAKRDQHLRGVDFFNASEFPEVTFKSTKVSRDLVASVQPGGEGFYVDGKLTLHGVTRDVQIRLFRTGSGRDMAGKPIAGVEGQLFMKRSDFGMKSMIGPVADDVQLTISLEGVRRS